MSEIRTWIHRDYEMEEMTGNKEVLPKFLYVTLVDHEAKIKSRDNTIMGLEGLQQADRATIDTLKAEVEQLSLDNNVLQNLLDDLKAEVEHLKTTIKTTTKSLRSLQTMRSMMR